MWFFRSNPNKIDVMITSLIKVLELPNFGHMITYTIQVESFDKILFVTLWTVKNYDVKNLYFKINSYSHFLQ